MQSQTRIARKLRVLRISHSSNVPAYRARERALAANHPVEVELIVPARWQHLGGTSDQQEDFLVTKSATFGTGSIPLFAYDSRVIGNRIKEFKPDIIDVHEEPYSVSCFQTFFVARQVSPRSSLVFYSAQNIEKRYPPPFCWTEQYVYKNASGAYPCSEEVKEVLRAKGFSRNSEVIPLGVDVNLFKPQSADRADLNLSNDAFVIGYFGRLEPYKGVQTILQALALDTSADRAQLIVTGAGGHLDFLRAETQRLNLSEHVHWIGEVDSQSVPRYLSYCDITVVPSITTPTWKEQFGRAVTESMACGVPVIASDSGSLPEVVARDGLLFQEGNAIDLLEKITKMRDEKFRTALSNQGLHRVHSLYTWDQVAASMYAFYERALLLAAQPVAS